MDFGKKLKRLLENPFNTEYRLDSACALACQEVGAACASILLYSGKEDKLQCDGRYLDPNVGEVKTKGDSTLYKIMHHMAACEYIHGLQGKFSSEDAVILYQDFMQKVVIAVPTTQSQFIDLLGAFGQWQDSFKTLKDTYREERFGIGFDTGTVTGDWYKQMLLEEKSSRGTIFIENLHSIDPSKSSFCQKHLEKKLLLTFTTQYYVGLPLSSYDRNFGILRFLFPRATTIFINTTNEPKLQSYYRELLETFAESISLHLEIDYIGESNKGTIHTSHEMRQDIYSFGNYLNSRCDLLADSIESIGAVIRSFDKVTGAHSIIGNSKKLQCCLNSILNEDHTFFEQLVGRFAKNDSIIGIYLNFSEKPLVMNECFYHYEKKEYYWNHFDLSILIASETPRITGWQSQMRIANLAIFSLPQYSGHYIVFYNSENRPFRSEDITIISPSLQNLGLLLKEHAQLLESKQRMDEIRCMHRHINEILQGKEKKCYEYLYGFLKEISALVEKLGIFPFHMIWECISEDIPENIAKEKHYVLRDVTPGMYKNAPIEKNHLFNYPRDEYFQPSLSRQDFSRRSLDYFTQDKLSKLLEIPVRKGYSYFDLPIFSENEKMPCWVLTLIYREDRTDWDCSIEGDFFQLMEHLAFQIGLTWDKFQEKITVRLMEIIDFKLGGGDKTKDHSTLDQLKIISGILSREVQVDWCAFFLVDEVDYALKLETSNIDLELPIHYSLSDPSEITVFCFAENSPIRLFGRKSLEEMVKTERMLPIEKALRKEIKPGKHKNGKHRFTYYVLFEHALLLPITLRANPLGVIAFYRSKNVGQPLPESRFEYVMRPFSQFETYLLTQVKKHVFSIFISHHGVQKRMRDIRNIIAQFISPISSSISATEQLIRNKETVAKSTIDDLFVKLKDVNALSKIATHYMMNFETLLDIDARKIKPKKTLIPDLRHYLIDFARIYTPLARTKFIHINVTKQTPSDISLEVDKDLFDMVISNIIDNAVKYSFDPEEQLSRGLQPKPAGMEDKENILIDAKVEENTVTITVSGYGIEIKEEEKIKFFEREFRGAAASDRSKGTGIGLYLAKEIMGMFGGSIELVSHTPKFNTIIKITLPQKMANTSGAKIKT